MTNGQHTAKKKHTDTPHYFFDKHESEHVYNPGRNDYQDNHSYKFCIAMDKARTTEAKV